MPAIQNLINFTFVEYTPTSSVKNSIIVDDCSHHERSTLHSKVHVAFKRAIRHLSNTRHFFKHLRIYLYHFLHFIFGYNHQKADLQAKALTNSLIEYFTEHNILPTDLNFYSSFIKTFKLNSNEIKILNFLHENVDWEQLPNDMTKEQVILEMLYGAYFVIEDGGKSYDQWTQKHGLTNKKQRISSHISDAKQYAIRGHIFKEFLFSTKLDVNKKKVTWFQLERYPTTFLMNIHHLMTYILYRCTGKNQGPFGSSIYRENFNEIVLHLKQITPILQ